MRFMRIIRFVLLMLILLIISSCFSSKTENQLFFDTFYKNQNYEYKKNIVNLFDFKTITECDSFIEEQFNYKDYSLVIPYSDKFIPLKLESITIPRYLKGRILKVKLLPFDFQFYLPNNENLIKYKDEEISLLEIQSMIFEAYLYKEFRNVHFALEENINHSQILKLLDAILKGYYDTLRHRSQSKTGIEFFKISKNEQQKIMYDQADFRIGMQFKNLKPPKGIKKPVIEAVPPKWCP